MASFFGISGNNASFFSSIFGTSGSNSSTSSASNIFSDYASIKNGTYSKLLKSYYEKNPVSRDSNGRISTSSINTKANTASAKEAKALTAAKDNALDLKDSLKKLSQKSAYEKDTEEVMKSVKAFIEDYNNVIKTAEDINNTSVLRSTLWMTNTTAKNTSLLEDIGIKINADNTLSLNEDKFKEADMTNVKSLFMGEAGYGASVSSRASSVAVYAAQAAAQANTTYTLTGSYDYSLSVGSMFDSLF